MKTSKVIFTFLFSEFCFRASNKVIFFNGPAFTPPPFVAGPLKTELFLRLHLLLWVYFKGMGMTIGYSYSRPPYSETGEGYCIMYCTNQIT